MMLKSHIVSLRDVWMTLNFKDKITDKNLGKSIDQTTEQTTDKILLLTLTTNMTDRDNSKNPKETML